MDIALSLKSGEHIEAAKSNYSTSRELLLVCPECGDPVHYKLREIPYNTPFFAHPKEQESIKLMKACSLRAEGGVFQRASNVVPGIFHGQLVDRFQREFCKELYESLGAHSKTLYEFIKASGFEKIEKKNYQNLIATIETDAPGDEILNTELGSTELTIFREGMDDICRFLTSPYGVWVGNFIYQSAYFVACMLHPGTLNRSLGKGVFSVKGSEALFVAEAFRLKRWEEYAAEILPAESKRNTAIPRIAATLVSFLVFKWRFKSHIPKLLVIADVNFDKAEPQQKPPARKSKSILSTLTVQSEEPSPPKFRSNLDPANWIKSNEAVARPLQTTSKPPILSPVGASVQQKSSTRVPSKKEFFNFNRFRALQGQPPNWPMSQDGNSRNRMVPNSTEAPSPPSEEDKLRIQGLVEHGRKLSRQTGFLSSKQQVLDWSRLKNPIEAYFLAAYLKVPHEPATFSDPMLTRKLNGWLRWQQ